MANQVDDLLKKQLSDKLRALGAGIKADGTIGFSDPRKDADWQQFQADLAKRGQGASSAPSTADQSLENFDRQAAAQTRARAADNAVTLDYAQAQIPLLQQKTAIDTNAYDQKLKANVAAQSGLLDRNYNHEQRLDLNTTDRLRMILDSDQQYYDKTTGLAEKQLQQQGTANILNLITNLALGGAALFA
jgi:hypothetical protein